MIVTTPELLPVSNRVSNDIVGALAPTGEFTARVTRKLEGDSEFESRQFIRSLSESNYTKLGEYRAQADGLVDDDQSVESQVKDVVAAVRRALYLE